METCKGKYCPRIKRKCIEHKCADYQHLLGKHPQTGETINHYDCAVRWHNILLIENSKMQNEIGASIQSLRNEMSQRTLEGVGRVLKGIAERSPVLEDKS